MAGVLMCNNNNLFPDPVQKVSLGVSDLHRSSHYWATLLGMTVMDKKENNKTVLLGFADSQVSRNYLNFFFFFTLCLQNLKLRKNVILCRRHD